MTKKIAILVEDQYQVLEVWYPWLRLREEGLAPVFIGSAKKDAFGSKEGYTCRADLSIDKAKASEFAAVIIPGGFAPDFMRRDDRFADFIKAMDREGKVVAAICHGGWMLVSADILKKRKATSFFAIRHDLLAAGAQWVDEEVVVDGNLITSRKPEDLTAFVVAIIKKLRL